MYSNERMAQILDILKQYNYVTVKHLIQTLHYSTATVNRDLNALEAQGLLRRFYGGVQLVSANHIPMDMRYYKMKHEKRLIAEAAAKHIKDGDCIFIDCSTTTHYLCEFIKARKNLTVITNSLGRVTELSLHGIKVICLGGQVVEPPYGLCSSETVRAAMSYRVDKAFFSVGGFYADGRIGTGLYWELERAVMENSEKTYLLVDHDKYDKYTSRILCDLSEIDYFFSDCEMPTETKKKFPQTVFVTVKA